MIDELRAAVDALNRGDPEPFVSLIDADSEWRGASHGHLWWKHSPACHGPDEARDALRHLLGKATGALPLSPMFEQVGDKIIGYGPAATREHDSGQERFIVFAVRDGKIVDMQGFTSRREAEKFARRS